MITVDKLLLEIVNSTTPTVEELVPAKDSRVLRSLGSSIISHFFITENQSRLLLKILKENQKKLSEISENLNQAINAPMWSRQFRQIEQVKKLYIANDEDGESMLVVEFTFNSEIRKVLQELSKKCENFIAQLNGKKYTADLTEHNIVYIVEALAPFDMEIDDTVKTQYATIKSWSETTFRDQFLLTNIVNVNFQKHITEDLGIGTAIDNNIITDRSMRYQYFTKIAKKHGDTLTEVLANRCKPKIWVDKNQHSLSHVIASLMELKRLPLLVVFDTLVNEMYNTNLKMLAEALDDNGIYNRVGVYFRLANDDSGKRFNSLIADRQYNYRLELDTQVCAVQSGKIPKFFLTNPWKPMSILALDSRMGLRHGKTAVYSNCCDLIVEWAEQPNIMDQTRIVA
jgi:hypothetical protein